MENSNLNTPGAPLGERTALVHKKDAEGALVINATTGIITQPVDERPEWAEGLTCALLIERHKFYSDRLGPQYAKDHYMPDAYAFEDLGWIAVDAEGEPLEIDADTEHRMSVIAEVLDIDRTADLSAHDEATGEDTAGKGEQAAVLIDMQHDYSDEEAHALEKAQSADFGEIARDGTGNK